MNEFHTLLVGFIVSGEEKILFIVHSYNKLLACSFRVPIEDYYYSIYVRYWRRRRRNLCMNEEEEEEIVCFSSMETYRRLLSWTCLMILLTPVYQIAFSSADDFKHNFISIDCGAEEGYTDNEHGGIPYSTDKNFIKTGINKIVPATNGKDNLFLLAGTNFSHVMMSSRVFEDGKFNCYTLKPNPGRNSKYLVRASFRYGNYDGRNQIPQFNLYIGGNLWTTVIANDSNPNNYMFYEIIYFPSSDKFQVCLENTGNGTPFISALELRPITNGSIYEITDTRKVLRSCFRYDIGYGPGNRTIPDTNITIEYRPDVAEGKILESVRYADDPYDRMWSQYEGDNTLHNWYILPDIKIAEDSNGYSIPQTVLQTMSEATSTNTCIDVQWDPVKKSSTYHAYFHFAELEKDSEQKRKSSISVNGGKRTEIRHYYQHSMTIDLYINGAEISNDSLKLSVCAIPNPAEGGHIDSAILNAIELYEELSLPEGPADVNGDGPSIFGKKHILVPVIISVLIAILLIIALIIWWRCKLSIREYITTETSTSSISHDSLKSKNQEFTYQQVVRVTDNFRTVIGEGGFGKVYLGTMRSGIRVAVKVLSAASKQGSKEFHYEATLLTRVHHGNLVSLIGYCNNPKSMVLIYEYMPNGNLQHHLKDGGAETLDWRRRLLIARDTAKGLDYLHNGCKPAIVHRDVKPSNILLNENWQAKISDFGLSRDSENDTDSHTTDVAGTFAYMDPEYFSSRQLNMKSDVYSFGVVLLELITGWPAMMRVPEKIHITLWVKKLIKKGDIRSIVDPRLEGKFNPNVAWKFLEIALSCVEETAIKRPEMTQVCAELKECLALEVSPERSGRKKSNEITLSSSTESPSLHFETDMIPQPR